MRKKILCMLLLIMISMLTGCESDFLGRLFLPHIPELELPPLTVRIYQDLSSEEWDINYYNGINLYKIDGNVYFKDEFRVNKIVGSKFEKANTFYNDRLRSIMFHFNNELYLYHYTLSEFSKISMDNNFIDVNDNLKQKYYNGERYTLPSHRIEYVNSTSREQREIFRYQNEGYYYDIIDDDKVCFAEYSHATNEIRLIKEVMDDTFEVIILRDDKYIMVVEFSSYLLNNQRKIQNMFLSIYSFDNMSCLIKEKNLGIVDYENCNFINYFQSKLYVFSITKNGKLNAKIIGLENNVISDESYNYYFGDYKEDYKEYKNVFDFSSPVYFNSFDIRINIFDEKYFYIVEPFKVSRINRQSGNIEQVYEVVVE